MHEVVINLHMHTWYSDGHATHAEIASAALRAGLDAVLVTDHNIWLRGPEGYHQAPDGRRVLLLVGEEIHDQDREPQKNHLLVFGAERELAPLADDPQRLIDAVREVGGLCFIAHPYDPAAPAVGEPDISWEAWEVHSFTGLELWNALSEFKGRLKSHLHALWYAFQPHRIARGPYPQVLERWDRLTANGQRVVAVGGSDAHALIGRLGPLRRTLFPYEWHFRGVNTHLLLPEPLNGDLQHDKHLLYEALRQGHAFIGYDLPASTRGFRFTAQGSSGTAWMGDELTANGGVTLSIKSPSRAEIRLLRNGQVIQTWAQAEVGTHITTRPGVYRVEVYRHAWGRQRTWIVSNPIYVR